MEDNNIPVSVTSSSTGPAPPPTVGRPMDDIVTTSTNRPSTAMPVDISEKKAEIPVTQEVSMPAEPAISDSSPSTTTFEPTADNTIGNTNPAPVVEIPTIPAEKTPAELIPGLDPKPSMETPATNTGFDAEAAMKTLEEPVSMNTPKDTLPDNAAMKSPEIIAATQPKQTNKKGKGAAILVAVLVALALIAGAGYAYYQNNKQTVKPAVQTQIKDTKAAKNPATATDVDNTSKAIDSELKKVDDTKDYQANDLTDTTLGL